MLDDNLPPAIMRKRLCREMLKDMALQQLTEDIGRGSAGWLGTSSKG